MADQSFPQIPTTVWWGVRQQLQRTPKAKLDENMLSATLGVQPAAAKQYIVELRKVGLLDEDGRATELANTWRMDDSYPDAVEQIARGCYPDSLTTIAPPGEADRQRVVNWFMTQGLGEGSAKNKAATYLLVTSSEPNVAPNPVNRGESKKASGKMEVNQPTRSVTTGGKHDNGTARTSGKAGQHSGEGIIPLNLNVQIHISADASAEQIETIFSSMRKYLRND